ncbi:MAG: hypothetical protein GY769_01475 [bacterium]|nr:hypothetical protein [bacterium]
MIEIPEREQQALREAGHTEVSRAVAALLVVLLLVTISGVPLLQAVLADGAGAMEVAMGALPEVARTARQEGLVAANRRLLAEIDQFEETLEEESFLRRWVLPPAQRLLTESLGVGNEQAYLGRDGWLFFRDDFDHVTGRGFLEPRVLKSEHVEGSRTANPLPAIVGLHSDLAARGIELVVMPTPVKPTLYPELLTSGASGEALIHNPSFDDLLDRLEAEGVTVFDPATVLADAKARGEGPLYLRTDTHWAPHAVELSARALASLLEDLVELSRPSSKPFVRRGASVSGPGDIARMLEHPRTGESSTSERTEVSRVLTHQGRPWKPDRESEVLLLGDSFTNIYSDTALGWGTGAGLAEQLSFELGRSVDRIALNAGGAWSSRQALARGVSTSAGSTGSTGVDRLAGKRVVVYQFATRELSKGDWKVIELADQGVEPEIHRPLQ